MVVKWELGVEKEGKRKSLWEKWRVTFWRFGEFDREREGG
jgi:hypothetical protein